MPTGAAREREDSSRVEHRRIDPVTSYSLYLSTGRTANGVPGWFALFPSVKILHIIEGRNVQPLINARSAAQGLSSLQK